ncbi:AbrB/MazE/SpoVT family DNA-binding domain-containing protein [Alteribacter populi]|uniref:AbrB/MazE/SpoVT family DNA-binding domain-containing protein n=1 Tax=Alteribacter populi TaxID=2011011 RepID=UPI000BBA85DF|nr:AbrB/MazE/SpoVT family DNA-binding domain-containing protein [Alteribacter populi]
MATSSFTQYSQAWVPTNLTCKMNKAFAITIPKKLRTKLKLQKKSSIALVIERDSIIISTEEIEQSLHIQSHINNNGSLYLPKEIRNQLTIDPGTEFEIFTGTVPAQFCELLLKRV